MEPVRIEKLRRVHPVEFFDCGNDALNRFLVRHALQNQFANAAQTYVALVADEIAGYYTLAVGDVAHPEAGERLKKGLARHPIPVLLLARLAVGTRWQGKGVGTRMLRDAMLRAIQVADIAGIRALVVHAKDEDAKRFYTRFNFVSSEAQPLHLFRLIKDLKGDLGNQADPIGS